jgi:hypothetical protein
MNAQAVLLPVVPLVHLTATIGVKAPVVVDAALLVPMPAQVVVLVDALALLNNLQNIKRAVRRPLL